MTWEETEMSRTPLFWGAAAAFAALAAPAASALTFVATGGNASACYYNAANEVNTLDAVGACTTALSMENLTPRDRAATHVNRGILQLRLGRADRAMADFDDAIRIDPALAEGYINRGAAFLRQENWRAAIEAISAGITRSPENPAQAYYNRAVAYEESGDMRSAYNDYLRAAELAPTWDAPRLELTRFQVR